MSQLQTIHERAQLNQGMFLMKDWDACLSLNWKEPGKG